jgi:putative ABC transport system substrate-binding protein
MERRPFLGLLGASALTPRLARAQAPDRISRVGILIGMGSDASDFAISVFRDALHALGYVEGRTAAYFLHIDTGGTDASLTRAVAQLRIESPDVVLAANTPAVAAMHRAAPDVPIVMVAVADPVGAGFIESRERPGGTITGLIGLDAELTGDRLALLKEVLPDVKRVGVLTSPDNPVLPMQVRNVERVAHAQDIELLHENVHGISDLDRAFASVVKRGGRAVLRLGGKVRKLEDGRTAAKAAKHRMPVCSDRLAEVQAGVLMAYGPSTIQSFREAATFVDRILRGSKPADLPVQAPSKLELALNRRTANALGIAFPAAVVARANSIVDI